MSILSEAENADSQHPTCHVEFNSGSTGGSAPNAFGGDVNLAPKAYLFSIKVAAATTARSTFDRNIRNATSKIDIVT
jgi:hypothetical protein